jgi:hypothetical protein
MDGVDHHQTPIGPVRSDAPEQDDRPGERHVWPQLPDHLDIAHERDGDGSHRLVDVEVGRR